LAPGAAGPNPTKPNGSPHADALALVLRTQADEIRKAEAHGRVEGTGDELWWHDTRERAWAVRRPFAPGAIHSTHLFDVTYRVDGKEVARWVVDTQKGTAGGAEEADR
jgi:hypothetical protein